MTPEPPGPRVFSRAIYSTPLPSLFRPPTSIAEYNGETKLELWLVDFRLACQLGGARGMTELSSASCHSSSRIPFTGGLKNSLPIRSTIGLISSRCSRETSKGPTYAPVIHATSASASRNQGNPNDSTLEASPSNALSSRTSPTMMSFWPLSQTPHARIWCES
jgi:hypothetical protein